MKKVILFLVLACCSIWQAYAQQTITVNGIVTDKTNGESMIGVSVVQKGTSKGTITDVDGKYSITVPNNGTLVYSYLGMATQEVTIQGKTQIDVEMSPDAMMLDEVVAIGYGTVKKRDLTGSIVSVKGSELMTTPSQSAISGLQGKVPGLTVSNSGSPGSAPTIRIRGLGSLSGNNAANSPFYLVDGMLVDNAEFVNPSDIESVEVLKDASSLAMFGIKGAAGIIIINTKRGQVGKTSVNIDAYTGFQTILPGDRLKLTNGDEFTELLNEQLQYTAMDAGDPNPHQFVPQVAGTGTNWLDQITQNAPISNVSFSVTSGNDKSNTFFSGSYFTQDGVLKYGDYDRFTLRFNNDYKLSDWWKIGGNAALSQWTRNANSNITNEDLLKNAVKAMPTYSPYKEDGSYMLPDGLIQPQVGNPVANMNIGRGDSKSHGYRAIGNIYTEFLLFKKLTFRSAIYGDIGINYGKVYKEKFKLNDGQKNDKSSLSRSETEYRTLQTENYFTYEDAFKGDHRLKLIAGFVTNYKGNEGYKASRDTITNKDRTDEHFQMLTMGDPNTQKNEDSKGEESQVSVISRLHYSFKNRYLLTATFRADASSKFSETENKWGYFPSAGLGWVISEESFMQGTKSWLDYLKLKGSWGQLGNDRPIGAYDQWTFVNPKGTIAVFGKDILYVPKIKSYADPSMTWEVMTGSEGGFEATLLQQQLSLEATYFHKKTSHFLAKKSIIAGGEDLLFSNIGNMVNKGIELTANWKSNIGDVNYSIGANFSYINNKITDLGDKNEVFNGICISRVGETIASYYGARTNGIFQNQEEIDAYVNDKGEKMQPEAKPGDFRFVDIDGDGKVEPDNKDRDLLGSYFAPYYYGFNFKVGYKGFDLEADFAGVYGNEIYDSKKVPFAYNQYNYLAEWKDRWHGEGTSNTYPILAMARPNNFKTSDFFIEDGSYLRLRNVQLGYNLPKNMISKIKLTNCRLYVNAQNLFTISSFEGWTPEFEAKNAMNQGIDDGGLYPMPTTITFGVNLKF